MLAVSGGLFAVIAIATLMRFHFLSRWYSFLSINNNNTAMDEMDQSSPRRW
jgi:hypothetical protein